MSDFRDEDVRVSARTESEGWIDKEKVKRKLRKNEHVLYPTDGPVKRHIFSTEGENVIEWNRHTLSVEWQEDGVESDTEIIVELRNEDAPWDEGDELTAGPEILDYEPVGANHVAGLEEEKEEILDFLHGIDKDFGLSEQTGIVLQGPPGTGKTELVREICKESYGSVPVIISGPEILSKWVGESERALRKKFEEARNTRHKVLYIDELDAIGRSRDDTESYSAQIVPQLLVLLDGVEAKTRVESADENEESLKVIASTNKPEVVDEALRRPGRLGNLPIRFDKPDGVERKAILHHYLEKVRTSEDGELSRGLEKFVKGEERDKPTEIVRRVREDDTEGFTGADIEDWVIESVKRLRKENSDILTAEILSETLDEALDEREQKEGQRVARTGS
jgi:transitional endoplasmic reticulum ATPase